MFLNIGRGIHYSMQMRCLFYPEIDIKLDHIWLWRYLWKKVTWVKGAFNFLGHLFGMNFAMT